MPEEKQLSHSELTSMSGTNVPSGARNMISLSSPTDGTTSGNAGIYGDGGPFTIWFAYSGGPASSFTYKIDNDALQPMSPGVYPTLSAQNTIVFQWQLAAGGNPIKFGWIFT